jgi:hypothetical protein
MIHANFANFYSFTLHILKFDSVFKWEVGSINVTDRFRQYQKEVIKRAEKEGLTYDNLYEVL